MLDFISNLFGHIGDWAYGLYMSFYNALIPEQRYLAYVKGMGVTLSISFFAILLGILIGIVVAVIKVSASESKMKWLTGICNIYINVIRGTPVYLQLLIIYNLIFTSRNTNAIFVGAFCFGINSGAYVAEIIRAGIESIDRGQKEAGRSLGLNHMQTMRLIILPQAVRNILPALGNEFIALIKETSIVGVIAATDIMTAAQYVGSRTWDILPPLFITAIFYLILVLGLSKLLASIERRMSRGDRR